MKTHIETHRTDRDLTVFHLTFEMIIFPFFSWPEVLPICSWLESQTEWAVYLEDMIRVNFRLFFTRHVFISQAELELKKRRKKKKKKKKKHLNVSFFLIACAKITSFAISKIFHFNQFSLESKEL